MSAYEQRVYDRHRRYVGTLQIRPARVCVERDTGGQYARDLVTVTYVDGERVTFEVLRRTE